MSAHRAVAGARGLVAGAVLAAALAAGAARAEAPPTTIDHATLGDTESRTPEISTADLTDVIARGSAAVIDTRSFAEYAISHIPGAISVAERPGLAKARSASDVGEIDRVLGGRRDTAIVLYGNGPFDGSTRRIADHLAVAGYTNVRRYQLGIPVWRALGGVTQIEDLGLRRVMSLDQSAVFVDARDSLRFVAKTLPHARNIPRARVTGARDGGEVRRAEDDGRLPADDHNARIIVFGESGADAYYVAQQLTREAFHNVSFYRGTILQALIAIGR